MMLSTRSVKNTEAKSLVLQMDTRRTFGCFSESVEFGEVSYRVRVNEPSTECLLCLGESCEHRLKAPMMCETAETPDQEIKRAAGRQFTVLFDKCFNGHVDEISRIIYQHDASL